jgi:hypothetical protein
MKEKREDTFYLFTLVNISEDSGLNGEYENKLFRTYTQARQFMESCIEIEMSVQESENHCSGMLERVGDNMAIYGKTRITAKVSRIEFQKLALYKTLTPKYA